MPNRVMVKLHPRTALAAAASRVELRPLFDTPASTAGFGLQAAPAWYLADLPDGGPTPWDSAHQQVADQLGVNASDVIFAEPDLPQSYPDANERNRGDQPFALGGDCNPSPQKSDGGRFLRRGIAVAAESEGLIAAVALVRVRVALREIRLGEDDIRCIHAELIGDLLMGGVPGGWAAVGKIGQIP